MQDTRLSLLDALRRQDTSAWEMLDREYRPFVRRQVRRILSNEADVDEITQSVFVVLAEKIPKFDRYRNGSFRKYLRLIASNQARDFFGRLAAGRVPRGNGTSEALAAIEQWADPNSELSRQWDDEHLRFCVESIFREARAECGDRAVEIFFASRHDGKSYAEIGRQFNLSEAQVGRDLHRVEQSLREILRVRADFLDIEEIVRSLS